MKQSYPTLILAAIGLLTLACNQQPADTAATETTLEIPPYDSLQLPQRPNIVWIVAEDLSPHIPAFGDSTIQTPNLDRLAREGVRYTRMFSPSGVCAPSRAAIALGMYPTRIGAMHMRTGPWWDFYYEHPDTVWQNRRIYEAMPPEDTHMHSTYLRQAGYYATNNSKQDYQFRAELTAWDESSGEAHWRNRPDPDQPFFAIFNLGVTHESQIWARAQDSLWVPEDLKVPVPPYLPDTDTVRRDLRRMYSNIAIMDHQVGELLGELETDGQLENTIVFWYGDHGGMLPRSKRTMYDSGLQVPLIVRFPGGQLAGQSDEQLLSFVDLKPTILSLAGVPVPDNLDGQAWVGVQRATAPRAYIHAAADDFDGVSHGRKRAVRDLRYKYIRNFIPDQPHYLPVTYREQMPSMQELLRLRDAGKLDSIQGQWFGTGNNPEALFDTQTDPFELHNLAGDPAHLEKLAELRAEMDRWMNETQDQGMVSEAEHLSRIWPKGKQPVTAAPEIQLSEGKVQISTATDGAAIGYQWLEGGESPLKAWQPYTGPVPLETGKTIIARAHRLGYVPSETASLEP